MIEVTKILDGGIDLRSGAQEPRNLVLEHNGAVVTMPISDEQLEVVLSLLSKSKPEPSAVPARSVPTERPPASPRPVPPAPQPVADDMELGESYEDPETGVAAW